MTKMRSSRRITSSSDTKRNCCWRKNLARSSTCTTPSSTATRKTSSPTATCNSPTTSTASPMISNTIANGQSHSTRKYAKRTIVTGSTFSRLILLPDSKRILLPRKRPAEALLLTNRSANAARKKTPISTCLSVESTISIKSPNIFTAMGSRARIKTASSSEISPSRMKLQNYAS